ncbi:MAG: hypothetical protein PWR20_1962 [Bacteroidales bacterium]|jgi:rhodanese-related sulfurtransferase|nr:hypothetical protein [Bacteroidales bacterium]MDN5330481.1 hypothetical protein [Bacteroidales bacterium]
MNRFAKFFLFVALVPALVLTSCKKSDDNTQTGNFETLKTYMVAQGLDLPALLDKWAIDAKLTTEGGIVDSTDHSIPGYYVFDLRSATDFAAGHIKGAINVALKDVVTAAQGKTDKPILLVCYTGQNAAVACAALRLSGFKDAKILKFGMAAWNEAFQDPWMNAKGNIAVGNSNWVFDAAPAPIAYNKPTWTSTATDGKAILDQKISEVLAAGLQTVNPADVLANPANYTIINFWPEADYTTFGHFAGAFDIPKFSLEGDEIKYINPEKEVMIYCYTGMTSAFVTTYFNILGYKTKSVKFGANALVYDALKDASKTVYKGPAGYSYVTGN